MPAKMPRPLIAANWKMNGLRREGIDRARAIVALATAHEVNCNVLVCPPAPLLGELRSSFDGSSILVGGQDCHMAQSGAHTGDVSAVMLADIGCTHVIVGHSERRADHQENDQIVCNKADAAHAAGLKAIICVGESEAERDAGNAIAVVTGQLKGSLPEAANSDTTIIAYEPCWAIGTGRTPSLTDIGEMHAAIHKFWATQFSDAKNALRVLYGGSVKAYNAKDILATAGVNGALVGGASLNADDFWAICRAAD